MALTGGFPVELASRLMTGRLFSCLSLDIYMGRPMLSIFRTARH